MFFLHFRLTLTVLAHKLLSVCFSVSLISFFFSAVRSFLYGSKRQLFPLPSSRHTSSPAPTRFAEQQIKRINAVKSNSTRQKRSTLFSRRHQHATVQPGEREEKREGRDAANLSDDANVSPFFRSLHFSLFNTEEKKSSRVLCKLTESTQKESQTLTHDTHSRTHRNETCACEVRTGGTPEVSSKRTQRTVPTEKKKNKIQ